MEGTFDRGLLEDRSLADVVAALASVRNWDGTMQFYLGILLFVLLLGLVGPTIAPFPYGETIYRGGEAVISQPPSVAHPLGTTDVGQDVLSRVLVGARATVITGVLGGSLIIGIGAAIGVTAGYVGGRVENVLMRFTDIAYGIPLIPFAIVLLMFLGVGFYTSILVIGLLLWRGPARVIRSQVLQIRERPFILAARATGASRSRIILRHVVPNVAPMAAVFFALGVAYSILLEAGLAFIGVSNPSLPSWGIMIRNVYASGQMSYAWWWSLPPGILITLTVLATIMLGRTIEGDDALSDV